MTQRKPWERRDNESLKAFEAFTIYRDIGVDRGYRQVCERLDKSLTLIGRWAVRYEWQERVKAYQDMLDAKAVEEKVKSIEKMHEEDRRRERLVGEVLLGKLTEKLNVLAGGDIPVAQIPAWAKTGVELIRISDGLSLGKTETSITGDREQPVIIQLMDFIPENTNGQNGNK